MRTLASVPSPSIFRPSTKPSPIINFCISTRSTHFLPSLHTHNPNGNGADVFCNGKNNEWLEEEIFEFMNRSDKPEVFPTRKELVDAGRRDLADAVAAQGGWLAFGWDLDKEKSGDLNGVFEVEYLGFEKVCLNGDGLKMGVHPDYTEASVSGRSIEEEESTDKDKGGIEGIIKRVERERKLSHLSKKSKKRSQNGKTSYNKPVHDPGDNKVSLNKRRSIETKETNNRIKILPSKEEILASQNGKCSSGSNGSVRSICDKWTRWSIKNNIQVEKPIPTDEPEAIENIPPESISNNTINNNNDNNEGIECLSVEREEIYTRLEHLESSLNSSLKSLRSKVKHLLSQNVDEGCSNDEVSDDWEFRETEIMKAKTEVRSLRARLSVLEGKMALKIIEAQKLLEENEKRYEITQKTYFGLKTICIVWPNIANEVLLAGSFNGWTNQRTMEKTKEGIFTLNLTLYPGQYEIKFIVDGVWKVDPLRPVVHNNGHENNLLTVM